LIVPNFCKGFFIYFVKEFGFCKNIATFVKNINMQMVYDIKKIKSGLKLLKKNIKGYEIQQLAALEKCSTQTIYNYLAADKLPVLALAASIIKNGNAIIKNRDEEV